ncbi:hypothetical protein CLI75_12640, partial [Porphyromonas gingivalis]
DAIYLNDKLFQRVKAVYESDQSAIEPEGQKLIQEYYDAFVRAMDRGLQYTLTNGTVVQYREIILLSGIGDIQQVFAFVA